MSFTSHIIYGIVRDMESNNPFIIVGYQGPNYFCDREKETQKLLSWIENGSNITLIALLLQAILHDHHVVALVASAQRFVIVGFRGRGDRRGGVDLLQGLVARLAVHRGQIVPDLESAHRAR